MTAVTRTFTPEEEAHRTDAAARKAASRQHGPVASEPRARGQKKSARGSSALPVTRLCLKTPRIEAVSTHLVTSLAEEDRKVTDAHAELIAAEAQVVLAEGRREAVIKALALLRQSPVTPTQGKACVHWWAIDPPNGPESAGKCKRCGATRMFCNSPADTIDITGPDRRKRSKPITLAPSSIAQWVE